MSTLFWYGVTVLCAAAASYLSGFVGEAIRGWREGRDSVRAQQRKRHITPPPRTATPGLVIESIGCPHADPKTIQRDVGPRGMSETKWCRDCGALFEHAIAGRFQHGPRWIEPRKRVSL